MKKLAVRIALTIAALTGAQAQAQPREISIFDTPPQGAPAQGASASPAGEAAEVMVAPVIEGPAGALTGDAPRVAPRGATITLRFKRQGLSMFVPARVQGRDVYFMLDTGANYTTLTRELATQLGVAPRPRDPVTRMGTASGVTTTQFGLMRQLSLGGQELGRVTYLVCDACGALRSGMDRPVAGLLGMNVLRRYQMRLDEARGVVELVPGDNFHDRSADIAPWLSHEAQVKRVRQEAGREVWTFEVTLRNSAPAPLTEARVAIRCEGGGADGESQAVSVSADAARTLSVTTGACMRYRVAPLTLRW